MVHSPDGHSNQSWARLKPGTPPWFSHMRGRGLSSWATLCCFLGHVAGGSIRITPIRDANIIISVLTCRTTADGLKKFLESDVIVQVEDSFQTLASSSMVPRLSTNLCGGLVYVLGGRGHPLVPRFLEHREVLSWWLQFY